MGECIHLGTRILGADHPYTLSSSAAFTVWQESKISSSATSDLITTEGELGRLEESSHHATHLGPPKKGFLASLKQKFHL